MIAFIQTFWPVLVAAALVTIGIVAMGIWLSLGRTDASAVEYPTAEEVLADVSPIDRQAALGSPMAIAVQMHEQGKL